MSSNLHYRIFHRAFVFIFSVSYSLLLLFLYKHYAAVNWLIYGFYYGGITFHEWFLLIFSLFSWALVVPIRITKPSCIFIMATYLLIAIPSIVAIICYDDRYTKVNLYLLGLVFCLCFFLFSLAIGQQNRIPHATNERVLHKPYLRLIQLVYFFLLAVLLYNYWAIMNFSALDEIYAQREKGAATNLYLAYAQTYFSYVFSPLLLSLGLCYKSKLNILLGCLGSLILFAITAEKTALLLPVFIYFVYRAIDSKKQIYNSLLTYMVLVNAVLFLSIFQFFSLSKFILWYLGVRLILTPGHFIVMYSDFFDKYGYTYLSHIRGPNMLIETPNAYASNELWPAIGRLVGEYQIGLEGLNANANFIASDGIASFGLVGIPLAFSLFAVFLLVMNRVTRGINFSLVVPLLFPLALNLTNGSLFTLITSFGGGLFIIMFLFLFKKPRYTNVSHVKLYTL